MAESKADDHAEVRRSVAQRVRDAVGLPAKEIVLVEPGSLPEDQLRQAPALALRARYLGEELKRCSSTADATIEPTDEARPRRQRVVTTQVDPPPSTAGGWAEWAEGLRRP